MDKAYGLSLGESELVQKVAQEMLKLLKLNFSITTQPKPGKSHLIDDVVKRKAV